MSDEPELTAEDILSSDDRKVIDVSVPEWGKAPVHVRAMSAAQVMQLSELPAKADSLVVLVAASVVDKQGNPLFSAADVERLKDKSVAALGRIQTAALKLNNMNADAKEESAAKNA